MEEGKIIQLSRETRTCKEGEEEGRRKEGRKTKEKEKEKKFITLTRYSWPEKGGEKKRDAEGEGIEAGVSLHSTPAFDCGGKGEEELISKRK